MLYHLLYPLSSIFAGFNVFRYITFRCVGATVTAFLLMVWLGPWFIRLLQERQIGQVIRELGPKSHQSKSGVPTMGGVLILGVLTLSTLLWPDLRNSLVWLVLIVTLLYGAIGFMDDLRKIRQQDSAGLSPRGKLALQGLVASLVGLYLYQHSTYDGCLSLPFFKNLHPNLGIWYIPFAVLVIVGASNPA